MSNLKIQKQIELATETAWSNWSKEHPSLSKVLDGLQIQEKLAKSIHDDPEYKQALLDYNQQNSTTGFFEILVSISTKLINNFI